MTITTIAGLRSATEFERFALSSAAPPRTTNAVLDLRHIRPTVTLAMTSIVNVSQADIDASIAPFRPLLFGAAWKCLDLAFELGLHNANIQPRRGSEYTIQEKTQKAGLAALPPLSADPDVWTRVVALYSATSEVRHSLVHRQFTFSPTGDMTGMHDRNGAPIANMTLREQVAFAQAITLVMQALFDVNQDARIRARLVYELDQLAALHQKGALGVGVATAADQNVKVSATLRNGLWVVDIDRARAMVRENWPHAKLVNLHMTAIGSETATPLVGRLDEAPSGAEVEFDPIDPPSWVRI